MLMDDFDAWWLVDKGRATRTLVETHRKLAAMRRLGLDLGVVLSEPVAAYEHGRAFLMRCAKGQVPSNTRRDFGKVLNRLRAWRQERDPATWRLMPSWPLAPEIVAERPRFSTEQLRAMRSYRHPTPYVWRRRQAMLYLAENTGLRLSEIAALRGADVDLKHRRLWVASPAKRGPRRALPLPDRVENTRLASWLGVRRSPPEGQAGDLWTTMLGTPKALSLAGVANEFQRIGRELGFTVCPLDHRRTRGRALDRRRVRLMVIGASYGHKNEQWTSRYVGRPDVEDMRDEFRLCGVPGFEPPMRCNACGQPVDDTRAPGGNRPMAGAVAGGVA